MEEKKNYIIPTADIYFLNNDTITASDLKGPLGDSTDEDSFTTPTPANPGLV